MVLPVFAVMDLILAPSNHVERDPKFPQIKGKYSPVVESNTSNNRALSISLTAPYPPLNWELYIQVM